MEFKPFNRCAPFNRFAQFKCPNFFSPCREDDLNDLNGWKAKVYCLLRSTAALRFSLRLIRPKPCGGQALFFLTTVRFERLELFEQLERLV